MKISAMRKMYDELGTAANRKREIAMPNTEDHVIGSPFKSHDATDVQNEIEKFMEEVLNIKKIQ